MHQGHIKNCRHAAPGAIVDNGHLAYPTPTPKLRSSYLPDKDATMDKADKMYDDSDPALFDTPMEEDFFNDPDKTLVEFPRAPSSDEDAQSQDSPQNTNVDNDHNNNDTFVDRGTDDEGSDSLYGDVIADRWSEDTVQTEAMSRLGICVNTAARVLVCIACSSVIKPLELPGHLTKSHSPMSTSAAFSQELSNTYDLRADLDSRPGRIITAIYGLELVRGYLACDTCGYACKSCDSIGRHIKGSPGCNDYQACLVQTFRPSSKRLYFGVTLKPEPMEELEDESLDPVLYLKKKYAPTPFSNIPIRSPKTPRDANHFLALEKWDLYVEGKTGSEITWAVREREPELRSEVRICVDRFAVDVAQKLNKVTHEARAAIGDYVG